MAIGILFFGGLSLVVLVLLIKGWREVRLTRKLAKHAESVEGQLLEVDIKPHRGGVHGVVTYAYQVGNDTYLTKQSVGKSAAMSLLQSRSKKVTVLFLPEKPSLGRLEMAPTDYTKEYYLIAAILILCLFAVLAIAALYQMLVVLGRG